jgi:uncharacterized membrane protein
MMGGMMGQSGAGLGLLGALLLGVLLLAIVGGLLLLAWGLRPLARAGLPPPAQVETPLAILQRRYARGEIGPAEYARVRADLWPAKDNHGD